MKAYASGAAVLLWLAQASAQAPQLQIDDSGQVIAQHQHHHTKNGRTVTWVRSTGAAKSWSVNFSQSPCKEGSRFGSNGTRTCTINVACHAAGDAGCKTYSYTSATSPTAAQNDPDIIVDP